MTNVEGILKAASDDGGDGDGDDDDDDDDDAPLAHPLRDKSNRRLISSQLQRRGPPSASAVPLLIICKGNRLSFGDILYMDLSVLKIVPVHQGAVRGCVYLPVYKISAVCLPFLIAASATAEQTAGAP